MLSWGTGPPNREIASEYLFGYANRLSKTHKASTESIRRSCKKLQIISLGSLNALSNLLMSFFKNLCITMHKHLQKLHPNLTSHIIPSN